MHVLTAPRKPLSAVHHGLLAIVLIALVLRALIPVGYMPDPAKLVRGTVAMVVCTINGPQIMQVAKTLDPLAATTDQKQQSHHSDAASHGLFCAVGVALGMSYLPVLALVLCLVALAGMVVLFVARQSSAPIRRVVVDHHSPRGPPVIS